MAIKNFTNRIATLEASRHTGTVDAQQRMRDIVLCEELSKLTYDENIALAKVLFREPEEQHAEHPLYATVCEAVNSRLQNVTDAELSEIGSLSDAEYWEKYRKILNTRARPTRVRP